MHHTCICMYTYVYTYIHTYIHTYTCMYVCIMHARMYVCIHARTHIHMYAVSHRGTAPGRWRKWRAPGAYTYKRRYTYTQTYTYYTHKLVPDLGYRWATAGHVPGINALNALDMLDTLDMLNAIIQAKFLPMQGGQALASGLLRAVNAVRFEGLVTATVRRILLTVARPESP
jgi:hypothetical protein